MVGLVTLLGACGTAGPSSRDSTTVVPVGSTSIVAAPDSTAPEPTPPLLPADPGYRDRLGPYADIVLGSGVVPYGSVEHVDYVVACVEAAGFAVVRVDGGIEVRPGPQQESLYRQVLASCEQAAIDSGLVGPPLPPDDVELAAWYEGFMWTHECMVEAGYPVSSPPSQDAYVEADGRNWHPYDMLSPEIIPVVERVCPQDLIEVFEILASEGQP